MALSNKSLLSLTENDLLALIADKEPEGKTLDYKRDLVGPGDREKQEFFADVSSFANSQGGHLVFGMEEENGEAVNLLGLADINPDEEILRLEQMLRDGIRPPVVGVQSVRIPVSNGDVAIVMHIPRSWNPPHQVRKEFRFYGRGTNGKYPLDVDELRFIYSLSASAAERLKLFRIERIAKIVAGDTPLPLENGPKMITHVVPLAAFTSRSAVDLNLVWHDTSSLVGLLEGGGSPLFNVDGLFLGTHKANGSRYVQVFRDGCVEVISDFSGEANQMASLPCPAFERTICTQLRHAKFLFECLGVAPPIVGMLTMTGMKGWKIATQYSRSAGTFDRDPIFIPELVLERFDGHNQDEVKPLLDTVWNAAGSPCSPNYDAQGRRRSNDI